MTENNRFIAIDEGLDLIIRDTVTGDDIIDAEGIEEILNDYEKENKQLKQENYELHKRLGDFELFEEHIKEKTSKTSVNDIIGLVKTDEATNSVELKKELYK